MIREYDQDRHGLPGFSRAALHTERYLQTFDGAGRNA